MVLTDVLDEPVEGRVHTSKPLGHGTARTGALGDKRFGLALEGCGRSVPALLVTLSLLGRGRCDDRASALAKRSGLLAGARVASCTRVAMPERREHVVKLGHRAWRKAVSVVTLASVHVPFASLSLLRRQGLRRGRRRRSPTAPPHTQHARQHRRPAPPNACNHHDLHARQREPGTTYHALEAPDTTSCPQYSSACSLRSGIDQRDVEAYMAQLGVGSVQRIQAVVDPFGRAAVAQGDRCVGLKSERESGIARTLDATEGNPETVGGVRGRRREMLGDVRAKKALAQLGSLFNVHGRGVYQ